MKHKSLVLSALFIVVITITTIVFNSCEKNETDLPKNDAISNSEINLKDGALSFETADAFFETSGKLGTMTENERQDWEASIGFVSMNTELINIFLQVEAEEDEATIKQIVTSNSDLVKLVDGEVLPIIESNAYAAITNRKGIFYVEGVIHKVEGGKIASSEDGNEQTVTDALHSNLKSSNTGVNVIEYYNPSTLKSSGCGTRMSAYKQHNKRKCDFEMKTYKYYCSGCCGIYYYQVKAESIIRNYKKNTWGKWKSYNTSCTMKDRGYTISVPEVTGYNGQHSTFYYHNVTHTFGTTNSSYDCATMTIWSYVGDRVQNIGINTPSFSRVKGKATNRGIGDRWAIINCGSW
jgi:hypothetical protein